MKRELFGSPRCVRAWLGEDELTLRLGDHAGAPRVCAQVRRHVHVQLEYNLNEIGQCLAGDSNAVRGPSTFQSVTFDVMFIFNTVAAWAPTIVALYI